MSAPAPTSAPQTAATQAANLSTQLDKQLAATAYKKVMAGEEPTAQERAALGRYERQQEEQRRWTYYAAIPQKHWRQMSGRQTKVLNEQAQRYGLPFGGPTINLPEVVRALHDFLAVNARKLADDDDDLLHAEGSSPALERYREERAQIARLDRLEREGQLVPRDSVRQGLGQIAALLRAAGESLQRECGPEARQILDEALDDARREIERQFGPEPLAADTGTTDEPAAEENQAPVVEDEAPAEVDQAADEEPPP
jgi:hypothetical protein